MSELIQSPSRVDNDAPRTLHFEHVRSKLPDWLLEASTDQRHALRRAGAVHQPWFLQAQLANPEVTRALRHNHEVHFLNERELQGALVDLPSLETFAEPVLVAALKERFGLTLDVRNTWLFHARRVQTDNSFAAASQDPMVQFQKSLKAATQTLLHAALQNFEAWEATSGAMDENDRQKAAIYDRYPIAGLAVAGNALTIPPHEFAALCRELDLGGKYQKKLVAFFNPPSRPGDAPDAAAFNRRGLLRRVEQSAFRAQVHLAYLRHDVSADMYRALLDVAQNGVQVTMQAKPVERSFLRLWDIELTGIVAIGKSRDNSDAVQSVVIYIPDDPVCPLKEYESSAAFTRALRDRLLQEGYLNFFQRFIPARHRAQLLAKLEDCLRPEVWNKEKGWLERQVDHNAKLHLREHDVTEGLLTALVQQKASVLADDALFHAVPTADEDQKTFAQRIHYFESLALQTLNAVGFFVPPVGAVMMAVAAAQLGSEVFEGIDSWTRGEWAQGWTYLMDVAENVALMAAMGAAHGGGTPVVETLTVESPSFIEELRDVDLPNGETRLWKPDIAPFAHDIVLPAGLKPDEFGVYHYQDKTWVSIERKTYSVRQEASSGQLRIEHPLSNERYQPPLRSNGAGAWLHPADRPLEWEGLTLFRRLGHTADPFSDVTARRILEVSDTRETVLRRALADSQRPPALLEDTMLRFSLDQEISQSAHGGESAAANVALFDDRYAALSVRQSMNAIPITRSFARLPSVIVDELVRSASAAELETLAQGRVPLRIAEEARVYQQQVRVARAYEGLYLMSVRNPDTDVLILHTLETLPGWSSDVRLELRDGRLSGPLVDAVGPADSAIRKVLVRRSDGFEAFDEHGHELHGRDTLYASILHALPDAQRSALGFPGTWEGPNLRQAVIDNPTLPRQTVRQLLNMQPVEPGRRSPMRLADGRLGYLLSGRGVIQGFIARETLLDLILCVGWLNVDASAEVTLAALESAGLSRQQIHQRLIQVLDERDALERSLIPWGESSASFSNLEGRLSSRMNIHEAIWRHWARNTLPETGPNESALRLERAVLSDFPQALPDFFYRRVTRLELIDVSVNRSIPAPPGARLADLRLGLEAFFRQFPELTSLEIARAAPTVLADEPLVHQLTYLVAQSFPALRRLALINQNISISFLETQALSRLEHLETLDLSGNTISFISPTNILSLRLRHLALDNVGIYQWPALLEGLASSTITELSLRNNRITEVPEHIFTSQTSAGQVTRIALQGNPLSRLALMRIRMSEGPASRFRLEVDVPTHFNAEIALMRQEREQLQEALDSWVEASSSTQLISPATIQLRRNMSETLQEFLRVYNEGQTHAVITFQDISLEDFPRHLPTFFTMRVRSLRLTRVSADTNVLNDFLQRFPQLGSLEMIEHISPMPALPESLLRLSRLTTLSMRDQGLLIDQQAIDLLGQMPRLEILDLSGNRLGAISDVGGLRVNLVWLSMERMGLDHWPAWVDDLLPLEGLSLEDNALTELPEHILQNPRNDNAQTEIALRGNPLTHETMRRAHLSENYHSGYSFVMNLPDDIRDLSPEHNDSDSEFDESGSDSSGGVYVIQSPSPVEMPVVQHWLLGTAEQNALHEELWQRLEARGDATNLMALVGRLPQSAPYRNAQTRIDFIERMWRVLEAADQNEESRLLYNGIAQEALVQPETGFQTCHDGVWLVFNQIEIQMFIGQSLRDVPAELRGQSLYQLTRRLYRLHELDAVAREQAEGRDEAEVRLAYRLRWAAELDLPLPPSNMLYQVSASIRPGELDSALARVQQGEHSEPFMRYAAHRDFWVEYLRETYAERFEVLKKAYLERMGALPDRFPGRAIDELGEEYAALQREFEAFELDLIRELTYRIGFDQN